MKRRPSQKTKLTILNLNRSAEFLGEKEFGRGEGKDEEKGQLRGGGESRTSANIACRRCSLAQTTLQMCMPQCPRIGEGEGEGGGGGGEGGAPEIEVGAFPDGEEDD